MEVKVTKSAQEIGLAVMLADLLKQNVADNPIKKQIFNLMKGNVVIKATDADVEVTLHFDKGKLTVYGGKKGKPDLEIESDSETIVNLGQLKTVLFMPVFIDSTGREAVKKMLTRELVIRGMLFHPLLLLQLVNVMSVTSYP